MVGIVAFCLVLGGGAGAGAYLLTRDDSDASESLTIPPVSDSQGTTSRVGSEDSEEASNELPESSSGSLSPTERGFPSDSKAVMRGEIENLLRYFHVALVDRDYRYAWSLLTRRKRQKEELDKTYSGWKEAQATLTPYLLPGGIDVQIEGLEGERVARVRVTGMEWTQPGSPCSEWSGLTWARYEGGAWRYDPGYSTTAERRRSWKDRSSELLGVGC